MKGGILSAIRKKTSVTRPRTKFVPRPSPVGGVRKQCARKQLKTKAGQKSCPLIRHAPPVTDTRKRSSLGEPDTPVEPSSCPESSEESELTQNSDGEWVERHPAESSEEGSTYEPDTTSDEELPDWTSQTDAALARTPSGVTELHRDHWTVVAQSGIAGFGLFAKCSLPPQFVLYAYTGTQKTAEQASRRPNAYHFDLQNGFVCDAGSMGTSSPARWVNTQTPALCNCEYKQHEDKLYLITLRPIPPMQELFASYGEGKILYAKWPQSFLGDAYQQVPQYKNYLLKPPYNATSSQKTQARELLSYLQEDLELEGLDEKLKAAIPFVAVLDKLLAACKTKEVSVLLEKVLTKCDLKLLVNSKAAAEGLPDVKAKQQDAKSKLDSLASCEKLQRQCIKAMSAMQQAVLHLQAVQEAGRQ